MKNNLLPHLQRIFHSSANMSKNAMIRIPAGIKMLSLSGSVQNKTALLHTYACEIGRKNKKFIWIRKLSILLTFITEWLMKSIVESCYWWNWIKKTLHTHHIASCTGYMPGDLLIHSVWKSLSHSRILAWIYMHFNSQSDLEIYREWLQV